MKANAKHLLAATALSTAVFAHSAPVVVSSNASFNDIGINERSTWAFSQSMMERSDLLRATFAGQGGGDVSMSRDTDGFLVAASAATMISTFTIDDTTNDILAYTTTGGLTISTPVQGRISTGGSATLTDMRFDLANKAVYATLDGANGVGAVDNLHLFDIASVTRLPDTVGYDSRCGFYNDCPYAATNFQLSGLTFTAEGVSALSQSLGLVNLGITVLAIEPSSMGDTFTSAVPEPSAWMLMGLGLVGMLEARRRAQR